VDRSAATAAAKGREGIHRSRTRHRAERTALPPLLLMILVLVVRVRVLVVLTAGMARLAAATAAKGHQGGQAVVVIVVVAASARAVTGDLDVAAVDQRTHPLELFLDTLLGLLVDAGFAGLRRGIRKHEPSAAPCPDVVEPGGGIRGALRVEQGLDLAERSIKPQQGARAGDSAGPALEPQPAAHVIEVHPERIAGVRRIFTQWARRRVDDRLRRRLLCSICSCRGIRCTSRRVSRRVGEHGSGREILEIVLGVLRLFALLDAAHRAVTTRKEKLRLDPLVGLDRTRQRGLCGSLFALAAVDLVAQAAHFLWMAFI
jgi:hypothetical protein